MNLCLAVFHKVSQIVGILSPITINGARAMWTFIDLSLYKLNDWLLAVVVIIFVRWNISSNFVMLDLTTGANRLRKGNCRRTGETFKFCNLVCLCGVDIVDIVSFKCLNPCIHMQSFGESVWSKETWIHWSPIESTARQFNTRTSNTLYNKAR